MAILFVPKIRLCNCDVYPYWHAHKLNGFDELKVELIMPTKKQRDRKRAAKPKGKKLAVVPKKKIAKRLPEVKPKELPVTDADVPDESA